MICVETCIPRLTELLQESGVPGHCRVCIGYGTDPDQLRINDPWPKYTGRAYWENWNDVTHVDDIYVLD